MSSQTFNGKAPAGTRSAGGASLALNDVRRSDRGPRQGAALGADGQIAALTGREREVCRFVAEGMTNKQVGQQLCVSAITVRNHLTSIFRKLSLQSRFELIVLSYQQQGSVRPVASRPAPARGRQRSGLECSLSSPWRSRP